MLGFGHSKTLSLKVWPGLKRLTRASSHAVWPDFTRTSYTEFLPAADEIVETPASPIRLALIVAICSLCMLFLLISALTRIDVNAVAQGRIQPAGRSKFVQPFETAQVRALHVHEGSRVKAGDVLIELDGVDASADRKTSADGLGGLLAEIERRQLAIMAARARHFTPSPIIVANAQINTVLASLEQRVLDSDLSQLRSSTEISRSKIAEDDAKIAGLASTLKAKTVLLDTMLERQKIRERLEGDGWETHSNVLDAQEEVQKERAEIASDEAQVAQTNAEISTLREQIVDAVAHFIADNSQALETAERKRVQAEQELVKSSERVRKTVLTSPVNGTVQQISVTTVGQVVSPGEQLLTIVPEQSQLELEALVQEQDIAFVKPGQEVLIKVNSLPFERYGTIKGLVRTVSHDSVTRSEAEEGDGSQYRSVSPEQSDASTTPKVRDLVFPVIINLNQDSISADGVKVALSPGMAVSVDIKTGNRTVLDYILSPLKELAAGAAHER